MGTGKDGQDRVILLGHIDRLREKVKAKQQQQRKETKA
jgi:hypothetical protein